LKALREVAILCEFAVHVPACDEYTVVQLNVAKAAGLVRVHSKEGEWVEAAASPDMIVGKATGPEGPVAWPDGWDRVAFPPADANAVIGMRIQNGGIGIDERALDIQVLQSVRVHCVRPPLANGFESWSEAQFGQTPIGKTGKIGIDPSGSVQGKLVKKAHSVATPKQVGKNRLEIQLHPADQVGARRCD
jgi:hypothetical protein